MDRWILDQAIDLIHLCDRAAWNRPVCVAALVARGIAASDAEAFISFAIAEREDPNAGSEHRLSFRQWARLRVP